MRQDELYLWFLSDPTAPRWVGQLRLVNAGKGVSLEYGAEWLNSGFPLSEDLLLVDIEQLPRWTGMAVGAVDDARPDRWGERVIQYLDKPARLSIMEYLYYAGDDRFGALGVSTSAGAYTPCAKNPLPRLAHAQQLSQVVHKVSDKEPVNEVERQMLSAGGSFGGAKPKALIEIAGEQWVIKFFNNEPIDVPLVEHASMTLAALAGITVAQTQVVPLVGENALAVRRFDRNGERRIHCISAGTALRAEAVAGGSRSLATRTWRNCCGVPVWRKTTPTYSTCKNSFGAWCSIFLSTTPMITRRTMRCWLSHPHARANIAWHRHTMC